MTADRHIPRKKNQGPPAVCPGVPSGRNTGTRGASGYGSEESDMDEKRYSMVYDGGDFVDSVQYDDLEAAKAGALDTLELWTTEFISDKGCPADFSAWTPRQIEEWDYMISSCSVEVRDREEYNEDDFGCVWEPSAEDEKSVGWMYHEELLKEFGTRSAGQDGQEID